MLIVDMPSEVEINVMRGYENPYSFGQREFYEFENKNVTNYRVYARKTAFFIQSNGSR